MQTTQSQGDGSTDTRKQRIRDLNDRLRRDSLGGRRMVTQGVAALPRETVAAIMKAVAEFDTFTTDNDPYGEHDFGSLEVGLEHILWKIAYYDRSLRYHSPDPTDPNVTCRVLTVMLAEEY